MAAANCCEVSPPPRPPTKAPEPPPVNGETLQTASELYFLNSVKVGEWHKAGEVLSLLERHGKDREMCQAVARAAEAISSEPLGLDALVELGAVQRLAVMWKKNNSDKALGVYCHQIASRFWERASGDLQWFLRPSSQVAAKALAETGREEWLSEVHRLAVRLHERSIWANAFETYRWVIERFSASLSPAHPLTLQAKNNFAVLLEEHGHLEDAEKLHRDVLEGCKMAHKDNHADHPDTLSSQFNLAVLRHRQGFHQEAEDLYRHVVERREKTLGHGHPDTLRAKNNLAGLLRKRNKLQEALDQHHQVWERRWVSLGRDHPDTLRSNSHIALIYHHMGRLDEAKDKLRQVLERCEATLGAGHPDTLRAMHNLAVVLEKHEAIDAESMHAQVWERLEVAIPPEKRRVRPPKNTFAVELERQGDHQKAENLLRQIVKRREATLGSAHPDTLTAQADLASLLMRHGQATEAEDLCRRVVRQLEVLQNGGAAGPVAVLVAKSELAALLRHQGQQREAEKMHEEIQSQFDIALGRDPAGGPISKRVAVLSRD